MTKRMSDTRFEMFGSGGHVQDNHTHELWEYLKAEREACNRLERQRNEHIADKHRILQEYAERMTIVSNALMDACIFIANYSRSEADSMAWLTGLYDGSVPEDSGGTSIEWYSYFMKGAREQK